MQDVEYRDIPGYPGYQVGSDGSVWSMRVQGIGGWAITARRVRSLSAHVRKNSGHLTVALHSAGRPQETHLVHRLVLTVFVGPCPVGMEACHENGNPADNRLANLRWDSHKKNMGDMIRHGRSANGVATLRPGGQGEANGRATITDTQVREIRRLYELRMKPRAIAETVGCTRPIVYSIVHGKAWQHVA